MSRGVFNNRRFKVWASGLLSALMMLSLNLPLSVMAQGEPGLYSLVDSISVPNGGKIVSVEASNESVRNVLYQLSQQAGFNMMLDDSVQGNISLQLTRVTVNEAMKALCSIANIELIKKSGNIYLAVSKQAAQEKGLGRMFSKVIKVNYSNANRIAAVLNNTIFAQSGGTAQQQPKVRADSRTNSLVLVGTPAEIQLAEKAILDLDLPRQSKTFYLSNTTAMNAAQLLASSVFNDGTATISAGGAGGGGGAAGGGAAGGAGGAAGGAAGGIGSIGAAAGGAAGTIPAIPAQMRVEREVIEEGSGVNNLGGSDAGTAGLGQTVTLRANLKESVDINISPEGPLIVPDSRTNSVTVFATAEQIQLAESMIPIIDAQTPQVSIEVSLVELKDINTKNVGTSIGLGEGSLQTGFNNNPRGYNSRGLIGLDTSTLVAGDTNRFGSIAFTTSPAQLAKGFTAQIEALVRTNKARILANPTVVAAHDNESIISLVDDVVRRTTVSQSTAGAIALTTQEIEIGQVGIVLDILPKVGEDGTVTMRLRPSVSTIKEVTNDAFGNRVTLLSKRDLLTQSVRVRDGETIVLGGLIQNQDTSLLQKIPGLGDLPIVGAMLRSTNRNNERTELVVMVTPHILNNTNLTPVNFTQATYDAFIGGNR